MKLGRNPIPRLPFEIRQWLQKRVYLASLKSFRQADKVLAISKNTKATLVEHLDVKPSKIEVTYLGPPDKQTKKASLPKELADKTFIVYIGGIDYRRDLVSLLKAARLLYKKRQIILALVGRDFEDIKGHEKVQSLMKVGVENGSIVNLGYVSDELKRSLYENALACVYPTLYEGFGLPLLEAFAYGCPIVTYDNSAIPEVGGAAAIYTKGDGGIYKSINTLLQNPHSRQLKIEAGYQRVKAFSWERLANETVKIIKKLEAS